MDSNKKDSSVNDTNKVSVEADVHASIDQIITSNLPTVSVPIINVLPNNSIDGSVFENTEENLNEDNLFSVDIVTKRRACQRELKSLSSYNVPG